MAFYLIDLAYSIALWLYSEPSTAKTMFLNIFPPLFLKDGLSIN